MQGYIENSFQALMVKKSLAEDKAKEIAQRYGYKVDGEGITGKRPDGSDNEDGQKATSIFDIAEAADGSGRWFAPSIRRIFPSVYSEIESHAGLVLVEIPPEFFPAPPDEIPPDQ